MAFAARGVFEVVLRDTVPESMRIYIRLGGLTVLRQERTAAQC